ncbi:hypothetical protein V498_04297 [Pseudogymnoascus sp. VKM F-4517 (FW-2822)]|nr:hypothetical protein V498_04297 [Pseudogymnoascus sp. VKM F-4517 (FW-2822)]
MWTPPAQSPSRPTSSSSSKGLWQPRDPQREQQNPKMVMSITPIISPAFKKPSAQLSVELPKLTSTSLWSATEPVAATATVRRWLHESLPEPPVQPASAPQVLSTGLWTPPVPAQPKPVSTSKGLWEPCTRTLAQRPTPPTIFDEPISAPAPATGRKSTTAGASDLEELPALESSQLWSRARATSPKEDEVKERDWIRERTTSKVDFRLLDSSTVYTALLLVPSVLQIPTLEARALDTHDPRPSMVSRKHSTSTVRFVPLTYSPSDSQSSALRLILSVFPDWEKTDGKIEFVRFTDGITNTLLKAMNVRPGLTPQEIDDSAVLLRAYGKGTDLIIDRERETQNHELLMGHGLAPQLLARFNNGMVYRYISGSVTAPGDLRNRDVYTAVAKRLAQWHAVVPCLPNTRVPVEEVASEAMEAMVPTERRDPEVQRKIDGVAPGKVAPNVWTVTQKWIYALPTATEEQRARQAELQKELERTIAELSDRPGLGKNSLVFAHCDLLSGNVIVEPTAKGEANGVAAKTPVTTVSFIDYEYAVPSPAAFDIANHFAEWGGFDCDFSVLPTRSQRIDFIREYVASYFAHLNVAKTSEELETEAQALFESVDVFRGVPGLYWGIWAIIQSVISQIDFDYASYAEVRLGEYYAWRGETEGTREKKGEEMPLRERRWAQEE